MQMRVEEDNLFQPPQTKQYENPIVKALRDNSDMNNGFRRKIVYTTHQHL